MVSFSVNSVNPTEPYEMEHTDNGTLHTVNTRQSGSETESESVTETESGIEGDTIDKNEGEAHVNLTSPVNLEAAPDVDAGQSLTDTFPPQNDDSCAVNGEKFQFQFFELNSKTQLIITLNHNPNEAFF